MTDCSNMCGSCSDHVADIRRASGIAKYGPLEIGSREVMSNGEAEDVDDLVDIRPDKMRANDTTAVLFDDRLVAIDALGDPARRVPAGRLFGLYAHLEALAARLRFGRPHSRDRRQREGHTRHAAIVRPLVIAFEQIRRDRFAVMARHGRQRWSYGGCIAGDVDHRVRHALQKFVELQASFLDGNTRHGKVECGNVRNTPSRVHDEIGLDHRLRHAATGADAETCRYRLHRRDGGAGPRRDVRELGCDVAAADQREALGQRLQLEKAVAGRDMLLAGDAERHRTSAGRYQDVLALQDRSIDIDGIAADEACQAVERIDASLGVTAFLLLRYGVGERALEGHQRRPVDAPITIDAAAMHAARKIDDLGAADQHLLGVAAAQRAGAAERAVVDDGHRAPRGAYAGAGDLGSRSGADDNEIVALHDVTHDEGGAAIGRSR